MLIIPKTTGEPVAAFGVPSAELDAAGAALDELADVVAPAEALVPALLDDESDDELPHAATETAAMAHAPRTAPLLLSFDFISTSLCCSGLCLEPEGVSVRVRATLDCVPPRRIYTVAQSVCK